MPSTPPSHDPAARIEAAWRELRRGAATGVLRGDLLDGGGAALDLGQLDTLEALTARGACRVSELAEILRVDVSSATRAVDRLERLGLARRERMEGDARGVRVVLTDEGRERRAAIQARRSIAMDTILSGFDGGERDLLAELLERMVAGMDAAAATDGIDPVLAARRAAAAARRSTMEAARPAAEAKERPPSRRAVQR